MKVEKKLLQNENQLLLDVVDTLEAKVSSSFEDGYFTAFYEAIHVLPTDLDLQSTLGWNQEQILAKATDLSRGDPYQGVLLMMPLSRIPLYLRDLTCLLLSWSKRLRKRFRILPFLKKSRRRILCLLLMSFQWKMMSL